MWDEDETRKKTDMFATTDVTNKIEEMESLTIKSGVGGWTILTL